MGSKIPSATLFEGNPGGKVATESLFAGKKVVLVGVPGAFTPTCSASHLPGYIKAAADLKAKGVSELVCISVNDPFVHAAWGKDQKADGKVRMLADTNAEFTKALGLDVELGVLGGIRCKRFSAVVDNGVVTKLNIEPENGTGESCSAAGKLIL